ncbi:MAG: hypothetical protein M0R75_14825 [Dehalococcoidia bacterium]|nr:hypothetical protein [Dehalococcoidia bacterium]
MAAQKAPTGLKAKGRRFWQEVTGKYDLRIDELRILEDACREVDLIDRIEKALNARGAQLTVRGSQGQPVANPLIAEVRQHRTVLKSLLSSLKLPDEAADQEKRSTSAREAAMARWSRRGA